MPPNSIAPVTPPTAYSPSGEQNNDASGRAELQKPEGIRLSSNPVDDFPNKKDLFNVLFKLEEAEAVKLIARSTISETEKTVLISMYETTQIDETKTEVIEHSA
jgi:hypothetical protein